MMEISTNNPILVSIPFDLEGSPVARFLADAVKILRESRKIEIHVTDTASPDARRIRSSTIIEGLRELASILAATGHGPESDMVEVVVERGLERKELGGLGLNCSQILGEGDIKELLFLVEAWLESLNSQERTHRSVRPGLQTRQATVRPMTLAEKIFVHHMAGGCPGRGVQEGDVITVAVDWVVTSEAGWFAMSKTFDEMKATEIWRNDRFWIAGDHVVDPRINHLPNVKALIEASEKAKTDFKLTEYQGMNFTIMHTEFVRERAEPGMIVIGADSHTCSAGAVGCLAIGLGVADVMIPLVTGQTWFKVPQSILISFVGAPRFGVGGKDVILHILGELKRNTVAADRIVEFSGPGARFLSIDARFAICNMCTEFGAITGVFVPDEITLDYVSRRRRKRNKSNSVYFQPDEGAVYSAKFEIDLASVQHTIALYPSPDNVVPIGERRDMAFDGVFLGACTTTEEDLVLAGRVLQAGLRRGLKPVRRGRRHVVPGSLPIMDKLQRLGLLEVYEAAGFTRGVPGCSFCVGMGADKAGPGETWLSSQNRNFKNRMGPGSFGNITSAAVVAASSFSMCLTDPAPLLDDIKRGMDQEDLRHVEGMGFLSVKYQEPFVGSQEDAASSCASPAANSEDGAERRTDAVKSRIILLGDFVDTDALAPAEYLMSAQDDEELGDHCMEHTYPEFRDRVRGGQQVVVGGHAFGCGSSREQAVRALKVQAVIARSFSFIYGRNQPSLGLLGITLADDRFYALAKDNESIEVDIQSRVVKVSGTEFPFVLTDIEYQLTVNKGLQEMYKVYGKDIWKQATAEASPARQLGGLIDERAHVGGGGEALAW
ncbi:Aconitase domain-containing protein [Cladophialophora immunda]|nr:Aconitase domain-containing protein [Cladophialophora immunda]